MDRAIVDGPVVDGVVVDGSGVEGVDVVGVDVVGVDVVGVVVVGVVVVGAPTRCHARFDATELVDGAVSDGLESGAPAEDVGAPGEGVAAPGEEASATLGSMTGGLASTTWASWLPSRPRDGPSSVTTGWLARTPIANTTTTIDAATRTRASPIDNASMRPRRGPVLATTTDGVRTMAALAPSTRWSAASSSAPFA